MSEATPPTWLDVPLGQLVKGFRGVSYRPENLLNHASDSTVTLLRATNIQQGNLTFDDVQFVPSRLVAPTQILTGGDIAVCMSNGSKALVGKAAQYRRSEQTVYTVGAFCSIFKPIEKADSEFVFHLFRSQAYQKNIDVVLAGSAINNLKNSSIESAIFRVPADKNKRQKIASILTSIDTAIEKTEALIKKYQHIKAGLMHDLFTRGVLPNGQLRPPREQAPELYQETAIGWIPREWRLSKAGDLCSLITKGTTPASSDMWESSEGIRFLRVDNLTFDGRFDFITSSYRISDMTHTTVLSRSKCVPGDVLMNIVGPPLGKVSLVTAEVGEVNINQAIAVFRPTASLSSIYLLRWLLSTGAKRWLLQRAKQTSGQLNLTLAMCQELEIPLPSIEEQGLMEMRLQAAERLVQSDMTRLKKLQTQKLGLMQDLLTGKVAVMVDVPATEAAT